MSYLATQDRHEVNSSVPHRALTEEMAVIGSCILEPHRIATIGAILTAGDFASTLNRIVWQALVAMCNTEQAIDVVTLAGQLRLSGLLGEIGGAPYLNELMGASSRAEYAEHYAKTVKEAAVRRRLVLLSEDLLKAASDPQVDVAQVAADFETQTRVLTEEQTSRGGCQLGNILVDVLASIEAGTTLGMGTGLSDLDAITTGMHGGQLIVVAARPGMGKSALALTIAFNVAKKGTPVMVYSLEMPSKEIGMRLLSIDCGVSVQCMRGGKITDEQKFAVDVSCNSLFDLPVHVDDRTDMSAPQIVASARMYQRKHGIKCFIVDYLQLVPPTDSKMPREQQVATISRQMKLLAKSLDVPVIILSQLNRELEKTPGKTPQLSHLRESGAIEQDADQVWMLHRQELFEEPGSKEAKECEGKANLFVRKNRNGRIGDVHLQFEASRMWFRTLTNKASPW